MAETLRTHFNRLRNQRGMTDDMLKRIAKGATLRAIEKATDLTPPTVGGGVGGTGTRTGNMKAHWATDSKPEPVIAGGQIITYLANNMQYSSYVNDGHRMDRHFVPGLVINPYSGMLEKVPADAGGIIVGTKTSYVPGLYMVQQAIDVYHSVVAFEVGREVSRIFDGN